MITMKFGGTSVQDSAAIKRLIDIVKAKPGKRLVVVSALAKVTDSLLQAAELAIRQDVVAAEKLMGVLQERHLQIISDLQLSAQLLSAIKDQFSQLQQFLVSLGTIGEISPRSLDRIVAVGELCSSMLVAEAVGAGWLDARTVLRTDANFTAAAVDFEKTEKLTREKILSKFKNTDVIVTGGFIASTEIKGQIVTTTLGRGGSDYSAAILGAAIDSKRIEIWTDVNGVLTTDPRMVPAAKRITRLSFDEAAELAYFGAKVLHPATIFPAVKKHIPVVVLNSMNPTCAGTEITQESVADQNVIKALACKRGITLININSSRMLGASGFLRSVFEAFAKHQVSIDLISTSEVNVSLTLDPKTDARALSAVITELEAISSVSLRSGMSSVAAVGKGIRHAAGVGARIFGAFRGHNIHMISMGSSEVNISLVVDDQDTKAVIDKLHQEFFSQNLNPELFAENI